MKITLDTGGTVQLTDEVRQAVRRVPGGDVTITTPDTAREVESKWDPPLPGLDVPELRTQADIDRFEKTRAVMTNDLRPINVLQRTHARAAEADVAAARRQQSMTIVVLT